MTKTLLARLLVISAILISIIFITRHYEQSLSSQQSSIESLQEQLLAQIHANGELIENLARARKSREMTESELQHLVAMEWEKKYESARDENESLHRQIAGLQYQSGIDIARLERAQKFLAAKNNSINESLLRLTEINHELEQNITALESETELHKKTIARLETENKQHKKLIATLEKPAEANPEPARTSNPDTNTETATDEENKTDTYRHVRIQSLINAMKNQDSVARKNILVSVVPTIPNGVSGDEFLSLVTDMKSEDILAAIQLTSQYISRPIDNKTISLLTSKMNAQDAEVANIIFKTKE